MELIRKDIESLAENWGIGKILSARKAVSGVVNHNWIIKTKNGKFVLRGAHKDRKIGDLLTEHDFLRQLKEKGFSYEFPCPIPSKNGKSIVRLKGRWFWLYKFIEGSNSRFLDKKRIKQAARMMVEMHKISFGIKLRQRKRFNPFQVAWLVKAAKKSRKKAARKRRKDEKDMVLIESADKILDILENLETSGYSKLRKIPTHSDINYENLIFRKGKLAGIIDFDNWQVDTKINDITAFIIYECRDLKKPH